MAGFGIGGIGRHCAMQIALGAAVVAREVGGFAGPGESIGIFGLDVEDFFVLGERARIVQSLPKKLCGLKMLGRIGRESGGERDEFGIGLGACAFFKQKLDQFDASAIAVGVEVGSPDSVHGIVIVARGIFDGPAVGGDAGESKINGGILRRALPESDEIGLGFVETTGIVAIAERTGEAELVLRITGIAGECGAEFGDGVVEVSGFGALQAQLIELSSTSLLVGGVASHEVADCGETSGGGDGKNEQDHGGRTRNRVGDLPRHISYHDIILGWRDAQRSAEDSVVMKFGIRAGPVGRDIPRYA